MTPNTRDWSNWAATVIAIIGIVAGFTLMSASFRPSLTAENYSEQREWLWNLRGAAFLLTLFAPLVSLALALLARRFMGIAAGILAPAVGLWAPTQMRACCGGDESAVIGLLRSINGSQQA